MPPALPPPVNWNVLLRTGASPTFNTGSWFVGGSVWPGFSSAGTSPYAYKYGIGTGTSFAAPHVSGAAGMLRGLSPKSTAAAIKGYLTSSASLAGAPGTPTWNQGYGVPNVHNSAQAMIAALGRLTPLFVLYNSTLGDYLLTIAPQMASAAMSGGIIPQSSAGPSNYYSASGNATVVTGYSAFPGMPSGGAWGPRARLKVFTTKTDAGGTDLCHIFRYSYQSGTVVRHVYAVCAADRSNISSAWTYDGVEGYVYPPTGSQPAGTVGIYRWVNPSTGVYMLVANGDQAYWTGQGFQTDGTGLLGYAYLN